MIDYAALKTGLLALFVTLSGLPATGVLWGLSTENVGYVDPTLQAKLEVFPISGIPIQMGAERRLDLQDPTDPPIDPGGPLLETMVVPSTLVFRLRVTTYTQDVSIGIAETYLERMRPRFSSLRTSQAFSILGLGFIEMTATLSTPTTYDNRICEVAIADLRLTYVNADTDPTPYDQITSIEGTTYDLS